MFCKQCLQFGQDLALLSIEVTYTLKASYVDCQKSAFAGCPLCKLITERIPEEDETTPGEEEIAEGPVLVGFQSHYEMSVILIRISRKQGGQKFQRDYSFDLVASGDDASPVDPRIIGRNIASHSGSPACLTRIAGLLKRCQEEHAQCAAQIKDSSLPARVLDLSPRPRPSDIRIFETNRQIQAPYMTLSHCWGKPDPQRLILKQDNIASLTSGFNEEQLTPVFRDAVRLARYLGFRYLWIDALCIIQDSKSDWATESALMGSIYTNAALNIASSGSPDSNTPFLRARTRTSLYSEMKPHAYQPGFKLPAASTDTKRQGFISLRPRCQHLSLVDNHLQQPLQLRAWCYQERILATRTVFFDKDQFLWECHAGSNPEYCDSLEDLGGYTVGSRDMQPYGKPSKLLSSSAPSTVQEAWKPLSDHWYKTLNEFGLRRLTYSTDALPAMSSTAKHYAVLTGDSYLAGIWKSDFHRGLLWRVGGLDEAESIRSTTAPSWSWASLFCASGTFSSTEVMSPRYRVPSTRDAELIGVKLDPMQSDETGQMRRAALRIHGLTRKLSINISTASKPASCVGEPVSIPKDEGIDMNAWFDDDFILKYSRVQPSNGFGVEFLVLLLSQWNYDYHFRDICLYGLILMPSTIEEGTNGEVVYIRQGLCEIKPRMKDDGELADSHRNKIYIHQKVNPRKETFDETWDSWGTKTVLII
ncbi:Fc.00g085030.m01.CDS01 [Cosmosporella sp. VM-42]